MLRWLIVLCAACAPDVGGPLERQHARDRDDGDRLAAQLAELPGALRATVTLHRPEAVDPYGPRTSDLGPRPAGAAIVIVVDDHADRAAITDTARRLTHAIAPEISDPQIAVAIGAPRVELASVGPFQVEKHSRRAIIATLAALLAAIAFVAGLLAWRERLWPKSEARGPRP